MSKFPNSGAIFKNDRKERDNHPDYTGNAEINGEAYWISAWIKEGGGKGKFLSLSFKPKDEQKPSDKKPMVSGRRDDMDDEIPF